LPATWFNLKMNMVINTIIILVLTDSILSFIPNMRQNPYAQKLKIVVNFMLGPIRSLLPQNLPIDISPLILIFLIQFLASII